jgi:diketogulonate reductase-like aldo/keto reductase
MDLSQFSRRRFLTTLGGVGAGLLLRPAWPDKPGRKPIDKPIPASGERLPVIGLGTSRTFDVSPGSEQSRQLRPVMQAFFDHGGGVVDTSPMYGHAEAVIGELLNAVPHERPQLFAATKVWTWGEQEGIEQMQRSMQRVGVERFDLIQIHNLRDWEVQLETLKAWKAAGRVRYIGITTSHGRFHDELEVILQTQPFDFVQLSYNIGNRDVEQRLLPLARERGMAVLVNRPFMRGELFSRVRGKELPAWAAEFDCQSWAQFFLKFVVSHPVVTCAIPATSKLHHMIDNMGAAYGRLPDAALRERMLAHMQTV